MNPCDLAEWAGGSLQAGNVGDMFRSAPIGQEVDPIGREVPMIVDRRLYRAAIALAAVLSAAAAGAAATPAPQPRDDSRLAAHHWDLVEWSAGQAPQGRPLRLDFDAERGSFSADTLCNRIGGAYRIKGRSLRLGNGKGQFASTLMACPEPAMTFGRAYAASLAAVRTWRIEGDRLVLRNAKGETLAYRAAHKPAADAPRKFVHVSAETKPCNCVGRSTCLQVREKESDPWQLHHGDIVGFDPQPGIEYRLRIIEEKVANPPADGSSIRWTLDQVIEQRVVNR